MIEENRAFGPQRRIPAFAGRKTKHLPQYYNHICSTHLKQFPCAFESLSFPKRPRPVAGNNDYELVVGTCKLESPKSVNDRNASNDEKPVEHILLGAKLLAAPAEPVHGVGHSKGECDFFVVDGKPRNVSLQGRRCGSTSVVCDIIYSVYIYVKNW